RLPDLRDHARCRKAQGASVVHASRPCTGRRTGCDQSPPRRSEGVHRGQAWIGAEPAFQVPRLEPATLIYGRERPGSSTGHDGSQAALPFSVARLRVVNHLPTCLLAYIRTTSVVGGPAPKGGGKRSPFDRSGRCWNNEILSGRDRRFGAALVPGNT